MIVRKYTRRARCTGRSVSDTAVLDGGAAVGGGGAEDPDFEDTPCTQGSSQDPFSLAPFSSQDSSPWSLDPDLALPFSFDPPVVPSSSRPGKRQRGVKSGSGEEAKKSRVGAGASTSTATATLMEAQEFGEMMEHVDEVNFALDGLRPGQPARIRRASLLSLLSICETAQQRRILRAQGMTKRIVDAILGLNFDDSPSSVAAAALFFVLASDDDHLLDSPSCINFLLKLLNPSSAIVEDTTPTIGCKLLGIRKRHIPSGSDKGVDSSSRAIISKVHKLLLSCKEIKSCNGDEEETDRPELSSNWIALLTMEKACLSTVSFEDTSDTLRRAVGNFKERLRELGGLDAIFDVVASCHATMEGWFKHNSPSVPYLKDRLALHSLVLLLKCLKIMENAMFLSKDNQDHLLGMKGKLNSEGLPLSFVGVVLGAIKLFSGLSLLRSSINIPNNDNNSGISYSDNADRCGIEKDSHLKNNKVCDKRQNLSASQSEVSAFDSEATVASSADVYSVKKSSGCSRSVSCNGAVSGSNKESCINANGLKVNMKVSGLKMNSGRASNGWISIKGNASRINSGGLSNRPNVSKDVKSEYVKSSYDPFMFDEDNLEPSKWELATKKETSQTHQSVTIDRELADGCDQPIKTINQELSQLTNEEVHLSCEISCPSVVEEDSNLLDDCLLTAVKVLMNLTNDNPVGCQQIAACGGLDTMASLIVSHFPLFHLCLPLHNQLKENVSASQRIIDHSHLNNRHLSDHELDFLVAILGLLVNLVEKDSRNRSRLASARISVNQPGRSENKENHRDVITLLCSIFLANQGAGEAAEEGKLLAGDEASLLQGEREAEMMIIEAYSALLLAFLSTESAKVREAIARCLPNHNLQVLVPVLERFVEFHMTLNMISPETHSAVVEVIESCKGP